MRSQQKTTFNIAKITVAVVILSMALAACNLPGETKTATETPQIAVTQPENTPQPSLEATTIATEAGVPTTAAPATAGSGSDCLVGKWLLTDFTSYFASIQAAASANNSGMSITNDGVSGKADFTFNQDGTLVLSADNFNQKFTINASANGSTIKIPASVLINGSSNAKYTLKGDQITISDQQAGDLKITITVMGNNTDATNAMLGEVGAMTLYQYACSDADTLSLKVVAIQQDFAPLTLTREK
jgi:hypothetical protein